ncbi:hypothetical protein O4106_21970 [Rhodococcus pyridinivorans]|uniref:VG15 protein n=1 Tax=Rhodococcus pyridinivorans TaxID=103816 RepID=UPI0022B5632D|nr:hypothetical protein [Rhodococcus pyridinivorans]MCZ4649493.1 hypothetical protein [Rhodococcus pyridinivorans]
MLLAVLQAQQAAAEQAVEFVPSVLDELNIDVDPDGEPVPSSMVGLAGDGRPVESLLIGGKIAAKRAVTHGASDAAALQVGGRWLDMAVQTLMADTGRMVESVGVAARSGVGYVRMLNPPSCSRCVILAGRFYRYKSGFRRHPRCDCRHIPAKESIAGDLTVDPDRYFRSLPVEQQDKLFGQAGAQAIRDGADINQVVNARRGMTTAQVYGRELAVTTEGVTRRGVAYTAMRNAGYAERATDIRTGRYFQARAPRPMPESLYQIAENRADALRLLRLYGYLT